MLVIVKKGMIPFGRSPVGSPLALVTYCDVVLSSAAFMKKVKDEGFLMKYIW